MISNRIFYSLLFICFITAMCGMFFIPLMDIDASQYASISREMLENNSFLQVFDLGNDYLDKPPMLFWLSAISMKIFGISDWAYRIPSFLFSMIAVWSTYQLALLFYQKTIARLSALVLASSQAIFLLTHDVRCDTMLMGWVALSLWQMAAWYQTNHWKHFILAFVAIAGGMMTKGPIALMVPAFAFVPHFILKREWKQFFRWEYLVGVIIIALMLLPMSVGLYQQFDLHPGKMINGVPIQSGLRFYYWTQSFGRYTGENVFNEMNHFTFLLENMLWSFLPWIFLFLIGFFSGFIKLWKSKFLLAKGEEWMSYGGFLITYCILARSQAQLPHYIFVVFPLASIVTANFLYKLFYTDEFSKWKKPLFYFHTFLFLILWVAVCALMIWPFPAIPIWVFLLALIGGIGFFLIILSKSQIPTILIAAIYTVTGVNIFLNTAFYPNVLQYQLGNEAAKIIDQQHLPKKDIRIYGIHEGRALHFYSRYVFPEMRKWEQIQPDQILITSKDSLEVCKNHFPAMKIIHEGHHFGVTALSLPFLNPATREKEVPKYLIISLNGKQ